MNKRTASATGGQIRMIHTLKGVLRVDDDTYRGTLKELFGVTSSKLLKFKQAEYFIDMMKNTAVRQGLWITGEQNDKYRGFGNRPGMATPAQLRKIEEIWTELYPENDEKVREKALRAYLFKFFKVSDMRFLDSDTTAKAMYALKQMQARKQTTPENAPETHITGKAV